MVGLLERYTGTLSYSTMMVPESAVTASCCWVTPNLELQPALNDKTVDKIHCCHHHLNASRLCNVANSLASSFLPNANKIHQSFDWKSLKQKIQEVEAKKKIANCTSEKVAHKLRSAADIRTKRKVSVENCRNPWSRVCMPPVGQGWDWSRRREGGSSNQGKRNCSNWKIFQIENL